MTDLSSFFPNATASTKAKNPGLFGGVAALAAADPSFLVAAAETPLVLAVPGKRLRQGQKKLNKTEAAFLEHLRFHIEPQFIYAQAITLLLADGVRYTPDFVILGHGASGNLRPVAYEVKGRHAWDDSIVKLKVAARAFPFFKFTLAWRDGRAQPWHSQDIKP